MTPCPSPDKLLGFTQGALTDDQAAVVEKHIDDCAECRAVLSNLARGGPPPSFGRYRIDTVLGSGGMGIVYRAYDPQLARPLAIKVVRRTGDDTQGRARLVREAQALARLSHPNVCHIYDVGTEGDEVWLAMELIDGVSLRQWAGERRPREELIAVLLGAAEGIAAAHAAGLVHRDVKPENVLVTRDNRAIVTDFGLARHGDQIDPNASTLSTDPHLTATGAIAGTPAYLAPEQLLGDPLDGRVDQFAWAVMAWELITGSRPFPIVFAVRVEAIRAGLTPPPDLPPSLASALTKAMHASPEDRFDSMRELIDAIKATPTPAKSRARTAAIAGAVVAAAAGVAITAWQFKSEPKPAPAPTPLVTAGSAVPSPTPAPPPAAKIEEPAPQVEAARTERAPAPAPTAAIAAAPPSPTKTVTVPKSAAKKLAASPGNTTMPAPVAAPPQPAATTLTPQQQAVLDSMERKYCRSCAIASVDAFCHIPYDFSKPNFTYRSMVLDWGTVTKMETETGTFRDEPIHMNVITVRGQRRTYRFDDDLLVGRLVTKVGALLAICEDDQSDIYQLAGGPLDRTRSVITLSAPPKIDDAARLQAKHLPEIRIAAAAVHKSIGDLDPNGRYLINAKVEAIDGALYKMDRYWLDVPKGTPGASKIGVKKRLWMVVEKPEIQDQADGSKHLVVHAAAILDEIFP
ncbi:MAG: serine/threonine protein kinase [Kofleriaceae bacterium]|nr:serine/threonine protein kinase [Kofleriaceae bacterium]